MGDLSVLARIMLSVYDIFSLLRKLLKDGDVFPHLIETCSYLSSLLKSVRDRRSFPTCFKHVIIYNPSPRPSSTYLLSTTFIIDRRITSFIIHHSSLLSTINVKVKDIVTSLFINLLFRYQRLRTSISETLDTTFRSSPPSKQRTYESRSRANSHDNHAYYANHHTAEQSHPF